MSDAERKRSLEKQWKVYRHTRLTLCAFSGPSTTEGASAAETTLSVVNLILSHLGGDYYGKANITLGELKILAADRNNWRQMVTSKQDKNSVQATQLAVETYPSASK